MEINLFKFDYLFHPTAFKEAVIRSLDKVMDTLNGLFSRLSLKENPYITVQAASEEMITELWDALKEIDPGIGPDLKTTAAIKKKAKLSQLIGHCVTLRNYFMMIKKCGDPSCTLCKPPRLPMEIFRTLAVFPGKLQIYICEIF